MGDVIIGDKFWCGHFSGLNLIQASSCVSTSKNCVVTTTNCKIANMGCNFRSVITSSREQDHVFFVGKRG